MSFANKVLKGDMPLVIGRRINIRYIHKTAKWIVQFVEEGEKKEYNKKYAK
jgi:hypothetical protein